MSILLERVRRALAPGLHVEGELGAGGMGVVFAARDVALDRDVAVKVLRPEHATATAAERFLREARLLARVRHRNVIEVHQAGEAEGLFYFVMDRATGPSLGERLRSGPLDREEALGVGRDLLAALGAVHAEGVIHRDLKPANVFLEPGRAVLADFGIARTSSEGGAEPLTRPGASPGTPDYMAPEQFRGEPATVRADLYAAGMVIYECLTGRRWPALTDPATADWQGVPARVVPVLRQALTLAPGGRWPDAESFAKALSSPPGAGRRAGMAVLAMLAVVAVWWSINPSSTPDPWGPGEALPSTPAGLRLWGDGEALYHAGSWREADRVFARAIETDSTCLACRFRRVELDRWLEEDRDTSDIRLLSESIGRFAPAWQPLVRSLTARPVDRWALLDSVTSGYREFPLGWYFLGEERFNRGSLFGSPRREAIEALWQATELDGDFAAPRVDLALALIAEGDPRAAEAVAAVERLPPAGGLAEAQRMLTRIALAYRFPQGEATGQAIQEAGVAVWAALTRDSTLLGLPQAGAGPRVLNGLGAPAGALDLGGRFERAGRGRALQRSGLYAQMFALTALGRPLAADSAASRFLEMSPGVRHSAFRQQLAVAAVLLDDGTLPKEVAAAADSLAPMLLPSTAPPIRREAAWLRALAAIRLEDTATARRVLRDHLQDDPPPRRRARLVEAALLAASGDAGSALGLTDSLTTDLERWDTSERSPFLRAAVQVLRAAWQDALGQPERARLELFWHQHFHLPNYPVTEAPEPAEGDWALSTLASWRLARLLDRRDDDVCAAYRAVAERWRDGEPRFRARADTAATRQAALGCAR